MIGNFVRTIATAAKKVYNKACESVQALAVSAAVTLGTILGTAQPAQAALPAEATAAFTQISGNVTDILAVIWPIVALSVGGFTLIRLFKKGASKAV